MTERTHRCLSGLIAFFATIFSACPAQADAISPQITDGGRDYSLEAPNSSFYGAGVAGRLAEASALRFQGEQDTVNGAYDDALPKLAKAVQLDATFPEGHLLYARALTGKIKSCKEAPDQRMLDLAIHEWKLIWHHDADFGDQLEARRQAQSLTRLARALAKTNKNAPSPQQQVAQKSGTTIR
jgi:hypothetical protein